MPNEMQTKAHAVVNLFIHFFKGRWAIFL